MRAVDNSAVSFADIGGVIPDHAYPLLREVMSKLLRISKVMHHTETKFQFGHILLVLLFGLIHVHFCTYFTQNSNDQTHKSVSHALTNLF